MVRAVGIQRQAPQVRVHQPFEGVQAEDICLSIDGPQVQWTELNLCFQDGCKRVTDFLVDDRHRDRLSSKRLCRNRGFAWHSFRATPIRGCEAFYRHEWTRSLG